MHYRRWRRSGDPGEPQERYGGTARKCPTCDGNKPNFYADTCRGCYDAARLVSVCRLPACDERARTNGWCSSHHKKCRGCGARCAGSRCRSCYFLTRTKPERCQLGGCDGPAFRNGECWNHYNKVPCEECGHPYTKQGLCWDCFSTRTCSTDGCEDTHFGKGLCYNCYKKAWRADHPGYDRKYKQQRRARQAAVESEPYNREDVYVRDGLICQLCFEAVDLGLPAPDPLSPSIDHVVPISLGGPDTFENVQLAHLGCNAAKGNRVTA